MKICDRRVAVFCLFAFAALAVLTKVPAQNEDVTHVLSGVVKHIDRGSKKMVVTTGDGAEHAIKWTEKTTWRGAKNSGKDIKDGSSLTVKYTERAGEKTAVEIKNAGKALQ
jgi:Cu/Ag efflux protein CusF